MNLLAKYTGSKEFEAESGGAGEMKSRFGKNGDDLIIDVPVGSVVTDKERGRTYELLEEGQLERVFKGAVADSVTNTSSQLPIVLQKKRLLVVPEKKGS